MFYALFWNTQLTATDNVRAANAVVRMVPTRFQRLLWPQLGCPVLGNCHDRFLYHRVSSHLECFTARITGWLMLAVWRQRDSLIFRGRNVPENPSSDVLPHPRAKASIVQLRTPINSHISIPYINRPLHFTRTVDCVVWRPAIHQKLDESDSPLIEANDVGYVQLTYFLCGATACLGPRPSHSWGF